MATTPTHSVPDAGKQSQPGRKAPTKATKMQPALAKWRAGLTPEAKAELAERIRETQRQRWLNLSERERRDRLAGVKAWQREQRKAKRDAARAKAKAPAKAGPKAETQAASAHASVASRRTRKAAGS